MPLEDQKRILKELSICFKCCLSNKHVEKNCDVTIKCNERENVKHQAALYPGQAPWVSSSTPPLSQHGRERERSPLKKLLHQNVQRFVARAFAKCCAKCYASRMFIQLAVALKVDEYMPY